MTTIVKNLRAVPARPPTATELAQEAERAAQEATAALAREWRATMEALAESSRGVAARPSLPPGVRHDAGILAGQLDALLQRLDRLDAVL
jgi:hypothetical protein